MKIVEIKMADLRPYEKNAKTHPKKQVDLLAANIEKFGFTTPVLIDEKNGVIAGHGRLLAMKKLGRDRVPCVRLEGLSPEEVKALRLADNKIAELGEWDMVLAIEELKGLDLQMQELTGFDLDLLLDSDEKDDLVPDLPEEPKSKIGDLYELGNHRVLCGDSTKTEDMRKLMNGKRANMVFTDPPYNIDYRGGMNTRGQTKRSKILNDKMSEEKFYRFLFDVLKNLLENTDGVFYVCMSSSELHNLWSAFTDAGGHWQSYIIWVKDRFTLSRSDYQNQHEPIMVGDSGEEKYDESDGEAILYGWNDHVWKGGRKQANVWHFDRPKVSKEHPTMKPVMLCAKAIVNSSFPGGTVADAFLGSGSTLIACEKTGRTCYGLELDPKYVDVIVKRYVEYVGSPKIVKNGKEIVWE